MQQIGCKYMCNKLVAQVFLRKYFLLKEFSCGVRSFDLTRLLFAFNCQDGEVLTAQQPFMG